MNSKPDVRIRFLSWQPGPHGPPSLPGEVELELLKEGHRRGVYRTTIEQGRAIVKLSFHPLGRLKLARERRRLEAMRRRGLPAPKVIGEGKTEPGRWAMILEEVHEGVNFQRAWVETPSPSARRSLLRQLAGSVRDLHSAGIEHRDPHPANFLVGPSGSTWVDATGLQVSLRHRAISSRRAIRNLGAIFCAFGGFDCAPPGEWQRALRLYLGQRARKTTLRQWARGVLRASQQEKKRLLRRRMRRCLRTNRDFFRFRQANRQGVVRREAMGASWDQFLRRPDSLFEGSQILKDGRSTRVARILWNGEPAALKRYHRPGFFHHLKYLLRRSRAFKTWTMGYAFELASIPAPRPLAVLEVRRGGGWPAASYLVTEWVEGKTSDRFLPPGGPPGEPPPRALVEGLAATLGWAHSLGIWHGDLKPQNVFFDPGAGKISLVDLDGARVRRYLSRRRRKRDLERWLRDLRPGEGVHDLLRALYRDRFESGRSGIPLLPCLFRRFA